MNLHGLRPRVARIRVRLATLDDLDLLVRHRRGMWEAIADLPEDLLDAAEPPYRRAAPPRGPDEDATRPARGIHRRGRPGTGRERLRVAHARPATASRERHDERIH